MALQEGNERMRKEIVNNDSAVTHVIEFTIAITVFVLIFQAFTSSMHYRIGIDLDNEDNYVVMAREVISELTGSEGLVGNQTDWETLEFGTGNPNLEDGAIIGLLNSDGELDYKKCNALNKFPYHALLNELDLKAELLIEINTIVPNKKVCTWGGNPKDSTISISSERYMLYDNGTNILPAKLTVTVYEGRNPITNIYLTEVMYNPIKSGANYEWVEIYNPNSVAAYLSEWTISDIQEKDSFTNGNDDTLTLPGKTIGIVSASPSIFKTEYGDYDYVFAVEDTAIGNGLDDLDNLTLSRSAFSDKLSYTSEDGANGDGKTLTRECYNCAKWNPEEHSAGKF